MIKRVKKGKEMQLNRVGNSGLQIYGGPRSLSHDFKIWPITFARQWAQWTSLSCAGMILKNGPVCYGTSQLKIRVCAVTRYALLKTPTLKSNKR